MEVRICYNHHLIKNEDLNHHGTLYAGRTMEWFVEAGFIAASYLAPADQIVCLAVHGVKFSRPVQRGQIAQFESMVILTGRSRLVTYVKMSADGEQVFDGFITFVNVDKSGKALPHDITITPANPEEEMLMERARKITGKPQD